MITIHKSILHIMEPATGLSVPSQREMDAENAVASAYLARHIEKSLISATVKRGELRAGSAFLDATEQYTAGKTGFIEYSHSLAERTWDILTRCEQAPATDFVLCDFDQDGHRGLALLLLYNKSAFTHYVNQDGEASWNDIIRHQALLPGGTQKVESFAIIDPESREVFFADRKARVDGQDVQILPELLLECSQAPSSRDTLKIVEQAAEQVAEAHGKNVAGAVAKAKTAVRDAAGISEDLSADQIAQELFAESEAMQREFRQKAREAGMDGNVRVNPAYAIRRSRTHKIKTDTGIELVIPVEYFQNPEFVEFINNPDGSIAIELKNINEIRN